MTEKKFPLHPAQQDIYIDQLMHHYSPDYNLGFYLILTGHLDKAWFSSALENALAAHDVFRLRFDFDYPEPIALASDQDYKDVLTEKDFSNRPNPEENARVWMQELLDRPMRLKPDVLAHEHYLLKIDEGSYWYFSRFHHLVMDGFGLSNWLNSLGEYFRADKKAINTKNHSYLSLMKTTADYYQSSAYAATKKYWEQKIQGDFPVLLNKKYKPVEQQSSGIHLLTLNPAQDAIIKTLNTSSTAGIQKLMLAALTIYFARTTGQHQPVLGVSLHKRGTREERKCVGMFSGLLPFCGHYIPEQTLSELMARLSNTWREDYPHYHYLPSELKTLTGNSGEETPLFDVIVNYGRLDFTPDFGTDTQADFCLIRNNHKRVPLEIFWQEFGEGHPAQIEFIYNHAYFNPEEIAWFAKRFISILEQFPGALDLPVSGIQLLPDEELQLLKNFSNEQEKYASADTIVSLFKEQAVIRPDAVALQSEALSFTFAELDQESDRLAYHLQERGVKPGVPVPVGMDRSPALIISILALLKCGAAYVPIDPEYPLERVKILIADLDSPIAITTANYVSLFDVPELILMDKLRLSDALIQEVSIAADSAAYIMYTSGSTGTPKGVIVSHQNVVSLVKAKSYFPFNPGDRVLAAGSPAFDATTFEYWSALLNGCRLILANKARLMDSTQLKKIISNYGVNKMFFTTGWFNLLADTDLAVFEHLSAVIVGGERFSMQRAARVLADYPDLKLYNGYGPTENTTFSLSYQLKQDDQFAEIPIGRPLNYRSAYILDENLELLPIGVTGELYLGGAGLASGYFHQPELTAKAFIPHVFAKDSGERLYRTGDLASWLADGNIFFAGRKDDQVKIRGFRVEPAETEAVLLRSELIKQAVVLTTADATGVLQMIAYVVPESDFEQEALLGWLETQLPAYMIPSHVVVLDQIPLTANGKIDKKALPAPEQTKDKQVEMPRNPTEQRLSEIWMELLQRPLIGIHDDFFKLGGHSLMVMRVSAFIRNEWGLEVAPTVLFHCKTIARLAVHINGLQGKEVKVLEMISPDAAAAGNLPVSFGQERLWFIDRVYGSVQYHIPLIFKIRGVFDLDALLSSFNHIVNRHEVLRTVIRQENGLPYQYILEKNTWKAEVLNEHAAASDPEKLHELVDSLLSRPFMLSEEHLLRVHIIRISETEQLLVTNIHHIAADGWSLSIFYQELMAAYHAYAGDQEPELPVLNIQYGDYARWQRKHETALKPHLDYWQQKLSGTAALNLPLDFNRPAVQSVNGNAINFKVSERLTAQLKQLSAQQDVTLYMTLLSAFKVLMHRYCGQDDICVGTAVSGRVQQDLEGLIGFFVNTLALRTDLSADPDFLEVLQRVKATTLEAYDHQEAPFEKVVKLVTGDRDTSRSPLFQVAFILQNTPEIPEMKLGSARLESISPNYRTSQFDLHFSFTDTPGGLIAEVSYCTDLFMESAIRRLTGHFENLLQAIVLEPGAKIAAINLMSAEEIQEIRHFSNEQELYTGQETIVSLFKDQAALYPEHIALQTAVTSLTFRQLDQQSGRLAAYLMEKGVKPGMPVPVCIDRSPELIISILALLKAGCAYVPVDPDYPLERIRFLLADLNSPVAVVTRNYAALFDLAELVLIDEIILPEAAAKVSLSADSPAYIMYTSGSTGKPKGVLVSHRNVVSLVKAKSFFPFEPGDRILAAGSPAFDAATFEYWSALLNGARLVLAEKSVLMDSTQLKKIIRQQQVNKMFFTTGWFNLLADTDITVFETLSAVIVGGERFSPARAKMVRTRYPHLQLFNGYGPTENTTFSLSYQLNEPGAAEVPVGKPLSFRSAYILDRNQSPVPIGITGELYVGGAGLADGYFHQPELTAQFFIPHPFLKDTNERLYRTGDLARWLPDGNITFEGRKDDQVKIRGFRVEPGETEAALLQSSWIKQAVVLTRTDATGVLQLLAYVVAEPDFEQETVYTWLETQLPAYMIPAHILVLDEIPLTANGKVDKQALPAPEQTKDRSLEMPRNQTEQRLSEIWMELLQISLVSIHDDFFRLGGHSLMVMRVSAFIRNEWGLEVAPTVLFSCKTIARLAAHINGLQGNEVQLLEVISPDASAEGHLPVSFGQERLWFIDRLHGSIQYHIIVTFKINGVFDLNALISAFNHIVNRHEVLRTVIRQEDGLPYQHILEKDTWKAEVLNDHPAASDPEKLHGLIDELVTRPFILSEEHMLRAHIIRINSTTHILVANIHHIAADGWSMSILAKELEESYHAYAADKIPVLPVLPVQYGDYARWQRNREASLATKLDYWQRKLAGTALLNLPVDFARSAMQSVRGETMKLKLSKTLTAQLKQFSVQQDVTLYMTLLAAFKVLLNRYCSQDDICVGGAISGRMQQELEGLIGFFVNTLALRTDLSGDPDFSEVLQRVKATTLEAYDHQEAPFEKVVKLVMGERDTSRNPLFQVVFVLQNAPEMPAMKMGDAVMERTAGHYRTSQFDLHFSVFETADGLYADVAYCSDLFRASTIRRLTEHFEALLHAIVLDPAVKIADIPMLGGEESRQLLQDFSGAEADYPVEETIVSLFQKQVLRTPDRIALTFETQELSYLQLEKRSDALAVRLRREGVTQGSLVPICTGHALEMMIGIMGVLKAGGVYVPVDPEYPQDRIRFMLEDTKATLILVLEHTVPVLESLTTARLICLSDQLEDVESTELLPAVEPEHPAYIIYTSGSTGRPKGVIIPHRNVVRLFMTSVPLYDFNEQDVWTMFHSYCFDFSVWEMYGALFYGGRIVIVPRAIAKDTIAFASLLSTEKVTVLNQTPSAFYVLQEYVSGSPQPLSLRYVIFGGEALHPSRLKGWHQWYPECKLINMYGITETTVHVTYQEIGEQEMNSGGSKIGKPIPTLYAYILDARLQPVPIGVPGELFVAGAGVASGYLNREELTRERFIPHPFSADPEEKIYRTGDLGRWMEDGSIEYLGRIDTQVKIRGYRIEPGEIEHALNRLSQVAENCVVLKADAAHDKKLVCYYVPDHEIVKELEQSLYEDQVNNWKILYEDTYGNSASDTGDEEFNIAGWNDSFTGGAIPAADMEAWLNDIAGVILSQQPENVLEIGCGTGMIYYQLAPHIKSYVGVDLSEVSIAQIRHHVSQHAAQFPVTHLRACGAHEVKAGEMEKTDTVIMNSVIQYFPGEDYLTRIIAANISRLEGRGRIILGDVRDYRLLYAFKSRLSLAKIQERADVAEFQWLVDQEMMKEEELCFTPDYFYQLALQFPEISHVEIRWKGGDYVNELSLYRFTVILHIGLKKEVREVPWLAWDGIKAKTEQLFEDLPAEIAISGIPNPRLWKERQLLQALNNHSAINVRDFIRATEQPGAENEKVTLLLNTAVEKGYQIRMMPANDPLQMELLLELEPKGDLIAPLYQANPELPFTNIPLFPDITAILQKQIRQELSAAIPDYMIPADLIALQRMPVTGNGKTDRGFLSRLEDQQWKHHAEYQAPATEKEELLADIWMEILGLDRVGVKDNFFELGGDSIRVVKVAARIRKLTGVEVSVADIYRSRTILELAELLASYSGKGGEMAAVEQELQQLEAWFMPLLSGREPLDAIYPMSDIQCGMIYASLRDPESAVYHDQFLYPVARYMDVALFEQALSMVVAKHEILRTTFQPDLHEQGLQKVRRNMPVKVSLLDRTSSNAEELRSYLRAYLEKEREKPFNLENGPLWRATLVNWQEGTVFVLQFHHAILDGWSVAAFNTELFNLYLQLEKGNAIPSMQRLKGSYRDFVVQNMVGRKASLNHDFWKMEMEDHQRLDLFTATENHNDLVAGYSKEMLNSLKNLAKEQRLSLKGIFLGATLYTIGMLIYHRRLTIGLVTNNRPVVEDGDQLLGCFLNTVPFVFDMPDGTDTWLSYFRKIEDKLQLLKSYDLTSLSEIARINGASAPQENPFFDIIFNFINFHIYDELEEDLMDVSIDQRWLANVSYGLSNTFLDCSVSLTGDTMAVVFSQGRTLQSDKTLKDLQHYFDQVLDCFLHRLTDRISKQSFLSDREQRLLLREYNDTDAALPSDATLISCFEEAVLLYPENIALIAEGKNYTYKELKTWADQLATSLIAAGVSPGMFVLLLADRLADTVAGMLAIMKAGAAYVPVEPDMSVARINGIMEDTGAGFMVGHAQPDSLLLADKTCWISTAMTDTPIASSFPVPSPSSNAYVIYTSGSTGMPKGVPVKHRSVLNLIWYYAPEIGFTTEERVLQFYSFSFDASVQLVFLPLIHGATLVIPEKEALQDPDKFRLLLQEKSISHLDLTPGFLQSLGQSSLAESVKRIVVGGEECPPELAAFWGNQLDFNNEYGPTESTVVATRYRYAAGEQGRRLPIGKPIPNLRIYILDEDLQLLPAGVAGEICISGEGLSPGYLNRPEQNLERFIPDQFNWDPAAKMYRTGDIGRWRSDGQLEYLGRADDQVKIRGYRVEPAEVEAVLLLQDDLKQAAVVVHTDELGDKRLLAYLVPAASTAVEAIEAALRERLPAYMVPSHLFLMDELPLTLSGKIDRRSLISLGLPLPGIAEPVAPANEIERMLLGVWQQLLGIKQISTADDFFVLGGHSLSTLRLLGRIRQAGYDIQLQEILSHSTIIRLALLLEDRKVDEQVLSLRKSVNAHVLLLNHSGQQQQVFLLPGSNGTSEGYDELANALSDWAKLYGIQMMGALENEKPLHSMEEIAALQVSWIREIQPKGPYHLIGHSFGGHVLYEMIRQLEQSGEDVGIAVILDAATNLKGEGDQEIFEAAQVMEFVQTAISKYNMQGLMNPSFSDELKMEVETLMQQDIIPCMTDLLRNKVVTQREDTDLIFRIMDLHITNMLMPYRVSGKVKVPLTIVKATVNPLLHSNDALGWQEHSRQVKVMTTPGDHFSMLREPFVKALAVTLKGVFVSAEETLIDES
ncbi:amino acid adenylation domain-containing protein [Pedobacter cryoconitis]|uniref:non-ribosomal peptide synthetase n=1 Tax=Pedobacter cryoconitis TaxID=188932 RepID=UPI001620766D|nr:non-ribosomal peptide synthetase [Pedobacter cryoconitis]MBB6270489.1 amino acid adenylation domain-containing protein [Pedobacter cryoconitis]